MFKGIGNIASLMKTVHQMGGQVQQINDRLKAQRVTGSAGGGMVEIEANGLGEVLRARIDPDGAGVRRSRDAGGSVASRYQPGPR